MKFIKALIIMLKLNSALAYQGHDYSLLEKENQKIHVVKVDLKYFDTHLRSAHNSVFGREMVDNIAKREDAEIAVNAGFFQIAGCEDGRPTGTLIIDGKLFGLRKTSHAVFVLKDKVPAIETWQPKIDILIGKTLFTIDKFNKFLGNSSIILYSGMWGPTTLTSFKSRKEIIISKDMKVVSIKNNGNNIIPYEGYILSLPENINIDAVNINDQVKFRNDQYGVFDSKTSAVMGIPILLADGKISESLSNVEKHARTAIGIDKNGNIIIAVVENSYSKNLSTLSLKEAQNIFQKNNISINNLSVAEVKKFLANELSVESSAIGMTTLELAHLMQELGCISAINLDGGGSSSLYIEGKYVNNAVGDKDEGEGISQVRPISDAIIFKRK